MFSARGGFNYYTQGNDPYWANVTFLQNYENNLSFFDSSTNNFLITQTSTARPSLMTPFTGVGGSYAFNGTSDGLLSAANSNNLVTTDFTWECWVRFTALTGSPCIMAVSTSSNDRTMLQYDSTTGIKFLIRRSSVDQVSISQGATTGWAVNTWYHVAVVRNGNDYNIYRDGTSIASGTNSYSQSQLTEGISVGYSTASGSNLYLNGFISNARVVNGTAVYTSSFTPSTVPLTAITNTQLLLTGTNQSMFNNSTFVDSGPNKSVLTLYTTPRYAYRSPFSTPYSGSVFYDTSSALETAANTAMPVGTGAYTVEAWIYLTSAANNVSQGICTSYNVGGFYFGVGRSYNGDINGLQIGRAYQADCENCAFTWSTNTWYHVAVVRSSTTIYFFVDGVQKTTVAGTGANTGSYNFPSTAGARVAGGGNASTRTALFKGYISNFRVSNSALYTANFTPSGTSLTPTANTQILIGGGTGGYYDVSSSMQIITNSSANNQLSSQQKILGNQSVSFTATGYETVLDNAGLQLSTGDFTIEGWVYRNANGVLHSIACKGATTPTGWLLQVNASDQLIWISGSTTLQTSTDTIPANTWTYFSITRSGTTAYMFINGTLQGAGFTDSANYNQTTNLFIGSDRSNLNGLNGYVDNFRITKGVCRYTTTFQTPTYPFPTS